MAQIRQWKGAVQEAEAYPTEWAMYDDHKRDVERVATPPEDARRRGWAPVLHTTATERPPLQAPRPTR